MNKKACSVLLSSPKILLSQKIVEVVQWSEVYKLEYDKYVNNLKGISKTRKNWCGERGSNTRAWINIRDWNVNNTMNKG